MQIKIAETNTNQYNKIFSLGFAIDFVSLCQKGGQQTNYKSQKLIS